MGVISPAFGLAGGFSTAPRPSGVNITATHGNRRRARRRSSAQLAWSFPALFGTRTVRFERVRVEKNRSLPHSEIRAVFDPLIASSVPRSDVDNAVDALCEWYRRHGYLFSAIAVSSWPTKESPVLVLECMESTLESIKLISVSKDGVPEPNAPRLRTRPGTVERALGIRIGSPFRWEDDKFSHLMSLGVFEKAKVEVTIPAVDRVKLNVYLSELATARIEPGFGMNGDGRIYGDISVLDNNFLGRAQTLRVEWQRRLDMVRSAGGIEFDDPRIGASVPVSYKVRAYRRSDSARSLPVENASTEMRVGPFRSMRNPESDSDRDGAVILATYNLPRLNMNVTSGPIMERVHWTVPANGIWQAVKHDQLVWKSVVSHSTLKSPIMPRDGHRFSIEHAIGFGRNEADKIFQKLGLALSKHVPVGSFGSFNFSSTIGIASPNLPRHEMMVLGGNRTVRGYVYGELGRTPSYRTTRLEYRIPFTFKEDESVEKYVQKGRRPEKPVPGEAAENKNGKAKEGMPPTGPKVDGTATNTQSFFDRLPSLAGYIFADSATSGAFDTVVSGSSHGIGLRVAGVLNVEFARGAHGRPPRLHLTLVDQKH